MFLLCGGECWITFFPQVVMVIKELNTWRRDANCGFSQRDELAEMKGVRGETVTWTVSYSLGLFYRAHPSRHFQRFLPTSLLSFHHDLQFSFFFLFLLISRGDNLLLHFQRAISQSGGCISETTHFRLDPETISEDSCCPSHIDGYEM